MSTRNLNYFEKETTYIIIIIIILDTGMSSTKTNSLLLLSNIALGDLSSESVENGFSNDSSLTSLQGTLMSASLKKKMHSSYQSNNAKKFTRKLVLLPTSSTRLPSQSAAVHRGSIQLENDMPPDEVMKEVRTVLHNLGKKRYELTAYCITASMAGKRRCDQANS